MSLHLCAFAKALTTGQTNTSLTFVNDAAISQDPSGNALLPTDMMLRQVYGFGTGLDKLRIIAPSLKRVGFPRIPRFNQAVVPPNIPQYVKFGDYPPTIRKNESFNFQADNTDAGTQTQNVLAWLQDRHETPPAGMSYVIEGTVTITGVAFSWASGTITWEDIYPTVPFSVIGMRVVGTNLAGARLVALDRQFRPGTIGTATERTDDDLTVWNASYGVLTVITPPTFPQLEVYVTTAGSQAFRVYLQIVPNVMI